MKELHKNELKNISGGCLSNLPLEQIIKIAIAQINAPIGHNEGNKFPGSYGRPANSTQYGTFGGDGSY
ncbi:hypothetical protein CJJ18_11465 (plasmid) [Candidatus Williamhamiltonella defendens]|nr:bacteriocin [Candidatus Hamiltonella defensa]ASV34568.1 hypothetical protein CJJ18_11320 [Candidatus Hamiltonella defensa]ASV34581.1 hypothetical protein CJJ18_11465 [Candidatus Hamiltonella defensa]AWK17529.1 hypothetical protein CCS40_11145 [Candidatus Hamiltonella defensa]AWK17542.1 hypothetical protein CCS40_11285 [Candidatus Hamiltonella defensa]